MKLSYKKLWVKLVELDMKKTEFAKKAGISSASVAKLGKGVNITTDVLVKICEYLKCDITDIAEIVPDESSRGGKLKWQIKIQPILGLKNKYGMQPAYFVAIWMHRNIRTLFWD